MPPNAPPAFFSYSRDDLEFALRLATDLKKAGANVWMDKLDIRPGQLWERKVEDALTTCPRMLVILSPSAVNSPNVMAEVAFALDEQREVIPVLHRECRIPFRLRPFQYVDFRSDYAQGFEELLKTVGAEQQAAASAAAASAVSKESSTAVSDEDDRKRVADQARLEEERQRAAEQARLEDERKQAAERARVEEERRPEQARVEEERKEAAAEKARLEQEERERLASAEKARLEQEERERLEREHSGAPVPSPAIDSPLLKKIALTACGILAVALILYWVTRPKHQEGRTQTPEVRTQSSSPPPAAEVSSGSAPADKAPADKGATDRAAASKAAAEETGPNTSAKRAAADIAAAQDVWAAMKKADADSTAGERALKQQARESLTPQAMNEKGDDYYFGRKGVSEDLQQAVSWYRKAAEVGNAAGMDNLGRMYKSGQGVDKDYNQAATWFRKAAEAGDAPGMCDLGRMYEGGLGVDRDDKQAVSWYRKAAEAGDTWGMINLGRMYEHGLGVEEDQQQAIAWYRKAAQLGNDVAKLNLERLGQSP